MFYLGRGGEREREEGEVTEPPVCARRAEREESELRAVRAHQGPGCAAPSAKARPANLLHTGLTVCSERPIGERRWRGGRGSERSTQYRSQKCQRDITILWIFLILKLENRTEQPAISYFDGSE